MASQNSGKKFTHVIFDMDGLLLDTERIYTEVMQIVAAKYGRTYTWEMKTKMMGRPGLAGAQIAVEVMDLPLTAEEFIKELQSHKDELFPRAILLPGADRLVRHLVQHGVFIAVASGSFTKDYKSKTVNHQDFFALFHVLVLGDDPELTHGKPSPDQFLITARRFPDSPNPGNVLVFEDSPNGVLAAKAAGMGVVLVPDPRLDVSDYHNPTAVLASLEDFVPERYGLPPYGS